MFHPEEREGVHFPLWKQRDFTGGTEVSGAWPPYLTGSTIQTVVFFSVQELLSLKVSYRGPWGCVDRWKEKDKLTSSLGWGQGCSQGNNTKVPHWGCVRLATAFGGLYGMSQGKQLRSDSERSERAKGLILGRLNFFFFFCSGFCHTLKWNSHGFTCVPHPDPPSHLPLHPLPLIHLNQS